MLFVLVIVVSVLFVFIIIIIGVVFLHPDMLAIPFHKSILPVTDEIIED